MKKIILLFAFFCLIAVNPVLAQAATDDKSEKTEKVHACCKAKGGAENCCKKGMDVEKKSQCSKKQCAGACCKEQNNEDAPACCKAKGGVENCCKKGMDVEKISQCSKKQCAENCCKNKGKHEKKSWWKFW